jgi:two-component system response regulator PilR (NtrC family)
MVPKGEFREDLYYRINVIELKVPALRERCDDVILLAKHILKRLDPNAVLEQDACMALLNYPFPGNVRELENMLERAVTLCASGRIGEGEPPMIRSHPCLPLETLAAGWKTFSARRSSRR